MCPCFVVFNREVLEAWIVVCFRPGQLGMAPKKCYLISITNIEVDNTEHEFSN